MSHGLLLPALLEKKRYDLSVAITNSVVWSWSLSVFRYPAIDSSAEWTGPAYHCRRCLGQNLYLDSI